MKMALNKTTAPAFENPDDDVATLEDQAAAQRAAAQERLQAAANKHAAAKPAETAQNTGTALTKPTSGQVAKAKPMLNPLEPLKDAYPVEYDTLRNLQINQGNVIDRETGKVLGDTIGLELLSFQDQWVIGPGGDDKSEASKELVRYSNDGITTTKGEDCKEYLQLLKDTGHKEAKMTERMVICGSVFDIGVKGKKDLPDLQDSLVQINLPPTSKAAFKRYQMDQAFKIAKNLIEAEGAQRVKIECNLQSKGDNKWTVASFSRYDA
jgi:hypothetical protein